MVALCAEFGNYLAIQFCISVTGGSSISTYYLGALVLVPSVALQQDWITN